MSMNNAVHKALIDAISQHQAYLFRASSQSVNELTTLFNKLSNKQLMRLGEVLNDLSDTERKALQGLNFSSKSKASKSLEEIKVILSEWFKSIDTELSLDFEKSALQLAIYEATYTASLVAGTAAVIDAEKIYKTIKKTPYAGGQLVEYLFSDIALSLRKKVEYAIRDGVSQGLSNQQIIQKIKGRKSLNYSDGMLQTERYAIERQVRTARSHISNTSYLETYKALGFTHVKFVATLDGRVSKTCASLDQSMWEIESPKIRRPPLHPNCRSVLVGVDADGNLAGKRPFVMDERKVKDIPKDQRDGIIGQLDANTSFKQFFDKADDFFQREWLGEKRYKLFKEGNYSIDKFVDPQGAMYTLDELKVLDAKTFKELGL